MSHYLAPLTGSRLVIKSLCKLLDLLQ